MADGSVEGLKKADPRHCVAACGGGADGNRNRPALPLVAKVPLVGSANAAI